MRYTCTWQRAPQASRLVGDRWDSTSLASQTLAAQAPLQCWSCRAVAKEPPRCMPCNSSHPVRANTHGQAPLLRSWWSTASW